MPLAMEIFAAAPAEHTPPQDVFGIGNLFRRGLPPLRCLFPDSLGLCEYLPADQRLMGIAYHDPILRLGDNLLMADIGMLTLDHIAGINLICQNLPHGPGLPLAAASQLVIIAEQAA